MGIGVLGLHFPMFNHFPPTSSKGNFFFLLSFHSKLKMSIKAELARSTSIYCRFTTIFIGYHLAQKEKESALEFPHE